MPRFVGSEAAAGYGLTGAKFLLQVQVTHSQFLAKSGNPPGLSKRAFLAPSVISLKRTP